MAGGYKKIEPKDGKQFSKDYQPQNNGRKPKSFKMFNDKMKAEGYQPLTKEDLINCYAFIFSAEQSKIQEIAEDETQPLALRLIISEMTDERTRSRAMADFRDYMFGKATQTQDITSGGKEIQTIRIFELPSNNRDGSN